MEKQMEAHLQEESKLWSFIVLCQKQIMNVRRRSKERNLIWRNSRGQQLLDTFWLLIGFYFMHTICRFEAREVRSPMLQTVYESELKRRSYGCLKTTAQCWAKWAAKIPRVFAAAKPPLGTRVPFRSSTLSFHSCEMAYKNVHWLRNGREIGPWLRNDLQAVNQVANHLQVAESPPSCEITNSTWKIKVQTWKMDNSTCESPCEIHLCNLRYLQPT